MKVSFPPLFSICNGLSDSQHNQKLESSSSKIPKPTLRYHLTYRWRRWGKGDLKYLSIPNPTAYCTSFALSSSSQIREGFGFKVASRAEIRQVRTLQIWEGTYFQFESLMIHAQWVGECNIWLTDTWIIIFTVWICWFHRQSIYILFERDQNLGLAIKS